MSSVAKDKAWFTTYHTFSTRLGSEYRINYPVPVLGIGTVELTVKACPDTFTVYGTSTIELHNVLHVPSHIRNVIGRPLASVYQISLGGSVREGGPTSRGGLALHGQQIAHFQAGPISLFSLSVLPPKGMELGPSPFSNGASYVVSCQWPIGERARWQNLQDQALHEHAPRLLRSSYTMVELEYVNKHWGSEFRFLTQHRLKLHEERDRSEGRRIIRALMRGRDPAEKEEEGFEIDDKLGDHLLPNRGSGVVMWSNGLSAPRVPFF